MTVLNTLKEKWVKRTVPKVMALFLVALLLIMSCPVALADGNEVNASTWAEVTTAITNATADTTVILTSDIDVTAVTMLTNCSQNKITITTETSKTLQFSSTVVLNSAGAHLVFKNLEIRSCGMINVANGTLDLDNVSLTAFDASTGTPAMGINVATANGTVNIYGGSFSGWNNASVQSMNGTVNFIPTANISVDKLTVGNGACKITPQGSANISAGCTEVASITASETSPYTFATGSYTNLSIEVGNASTAPTPPTYTATTEQALISAINGAATD